MKRIVSVFLAAILLVTFGAVFTGCSKTSDEDFVVGLECAYAPFNWTQTDDSNGAVAIEDGSGYAGGYDIEIAKLIADGLGRKLVIAKTAWDGLIPALQSDTIDAIIAGMSPTAKRKESIDFTDNYYRSNLVIVVKKDSPFASATSIQDFAGAKLQAQLGTFHDTVIDQIQGATHVPAANNFSAMRVALESGTIDGYVSERPEAVSAAGTNSDFTFVEFAEGSGFEVSDDDVAVAVGINKGNEELVSKINEILAGISEEQRTQLMDAAIANQPAAQ